MPLSDTAIRNLKPLEKPYKVSDFDGLFVLVKPNGSRLWQFKLACCRFRGHEDKIVTKELESGYDATEVQP